MQNRCIASTITRALLSTAIGLVMCANALGQVLIAEQTFDGLSDAATFTQDSIADGQALTNAGSRNIGGLGLDFETLWFDTRGEGSGPVTPTSDSSDFIGVNSFTGSGAPDVGPDGAPVSSGSQHNFEFNDGDGRLSLVFEAVDVSGSENRQVRVDYWIADTGYESDDRLTFSVSDGVNESIFLDFGETDLEANASADDGSNNWRQATVDLDALIDSQGFGEQIALTVSVDSNSSSENVFIDNVVYESGVEPPPPPTITPIYDIQGGNHLSPLDGVEVITQGIVTAVDFDGFYLQDAIGDGDENTSDGIFVLTGNFNTTGIDIGDALEVAGRVQENIPGGADTGNLSVTRLLSSLAQVSELSAGNPLPAPILIGAGGVSLPTEIVISDDELPTNLQTDLALFDPAADAIDFWERFEGMRVTGEDLVAVSPTQVFGRFSAEAFTVANGGQFATPGLNARGGITLDSGPDNRGDQNPERIQVQFDPDLLGSSTPPEVVVGDALGNVTGVVGYSFGNYEINATSAITVTPSGLQPETTDLTGTEDQVTIASYNILNHSATAEDDEQRALLATHIVQNLRSPDIIGLQEVQDNNGTVNDGETDATQTLQALVDAIAAAGGPSYRFADIAPADGAFGGAPGGNIRNAYLWNPSRVTQLLPLRFIDDPAFDGSRLPLVGVFSFNGRTIILANNHWTSRFGSSPIFGGPQPFVQAGEDEREAQAQAVNDAIDDVLAQYPNARIVTLGDHNTFQFTNDLASILPGPEGVVTNLIDQAEAAGDAYSFIFDGNSQVLDHIFVSDALLPGAELDVVHVNNDFPRDDNRIFFTDQIVASDHEPLVARLAPTGTPPTARCRQTRNVRLDQAGSADIDAATLNAGSRDPDGGPVSFKALPETLTCADVGQTEVTLRVLDSSADFDECRVRVNVRDREKPTLTAALIALGEERYEVDIESADNCGSPTVTAQLHACGQSIPVADGDQFEFAGARGCRIEPGPRVEGSRVALVVTAEDASGNRQRARVSLDD